MIVQGTGSRFFGNYRVAKEVLLLVTDGRAGPHTLREGGADGADKLLAHVARRLGWEVETYDADWDGPCRDTCRPGHRRPNTDRPGTMCPAAGNYRNQKMIDLRPVADVCVALYKNGAKNKGTADCVQRAENADIPVEPRWG